MSSFIDLFNPSFLMFLGILVLVVAVVVVYFESKIRNQNHKIASMLSLVSTLAEDINGVKMGLNHLAITRFGGPIFNSLEKENNPFVLKENNDLIQVSDDEDEDEEDLEEDDDEDEDDENDLEEEEDDLEEEEDDELIEEETSIENEVNDDIKVLKLNISNIDLNEKKENIDINEQLEDLENLNNNDNEFKFFDKNDLDGETYENNFDFKTVNVNLEDLTDYKKLSLNKLKNIVTEKGLTSDASKLNKNKLLKLLGVE